MSDYDFYTGDYTAAGYIGISLPGTWRPFAPSSFWNQKIPDDLRPRSNSAELMKTLRDAASSTVVQFTDEHHDPIFVVNTDNITTKQTKRRTDLPYGVVSWLNPAADDTMDFKSPVTSSADMYAAANTSANMIVVDPFDRLCWEYTRGQWSGADYEHSRFNVVSTSNVADQDTTALGVVLTADQLANGLGAYSTSTDTDTYWSSRGTHGAGTMSIGGIIRPEEIAAGEIRHRLSGFIPRKVTNSQFFRRLPATSTDGAGTREIKHPEHGTVYQLDPAIATEAQFVSWGLSKAAKVVARAMSAYGVVQCGRDDDGVFALNHQTLAASRTAHESAWDNLAPGLRATIQKIPLTALRVMELDQERIDKDNMGP